MCLIFYILHQHNDHGVHNHHLLNIQVMVLGQDRHHLPFHTYLERIYIHHHSWCCRRLGQGNNFHWYINILRYSQLIGMYMIFCKRQERRDFWLRKHKCNSSMFCQQKFRRKRGNDSQYRLLGKSHKLNF